MKTDVYTRLLGLQTGRRNVLKGTASVGAAAAAMGSLGMLPIRALAQGDIRTQILQIPGVGVGSPTDADWQQVGALTLEPTKANVAEGEFAGVELTFMGLNNQNLHNFLFRGFLKPWEEYTGAKISWIDLAQADYNARLQQSIATGTVDFDIHRDGGAVRGRRLRQGARFRDARLGRGPDRDGRLCRLPEGAGRHLGWQDLPDLDRRRLPQLQLPHRLFRRRRAAEAWAAEGNEGEWAVPKTWQQVQAVTKFLKGKKVGGFDAYGYLDPLKGWGGFGFYFLASRATAYAKHPDDPAWLFDIDTMTPRVNNAAWVRAIQDVLDVIECPAARSAQRRSRHHRLPAVPCRHRVDALLVGRHRLERQDQRQLDRRRRGRLRHPAGLGRRLQPRDRPVGHAAGRPELRAEHGLHRLGGVRDVPGRRRRGQAQGGLERRGASRRQGHLALVRGLSLRLSSPIGTATSTSPNGSPQATTRRSSPTTWPRKPTPTTTPTPRSSRASPASSSITASPRTSWPRSMPVSSMPKPAPTTSPRHGRRSPIRSAVSSRSHSTRRPSASSGTGS